MRKIWMAGVLALAMGTSALSVRPAAASSQGRKNTALGLGAAAIYELTRGNTTAGIALGAGAAYGYKRYKDEKRQEDRDSRYSDRYRRYRTGSRYRPTRHEEYEVNRDRDSRDRYSEEPRHYEDRGD
jgi:hypothetical protein